MQVAGIVPESLGSIPSELNLVDAQTYQTKREVRESEREYEAEVAKWVGCEAVTSCITTRDSIRDAAYNLGRIGSLPRTNQASFATWSMPLTQATII